MKIITGTMLGFTEEKREYNDKATNERKSFQSRQLHVLDGFDSIRLELGRDFVSPIPDASCEVWVEVVPRVSGSRVYWTALKILDSKPAAKSA